MCNSLTAKQWLGLVAYKKMSPFKERRSDIRTAQVVKWMHDLNQRLIDVLCALNEVPAGRRPKMEAIDLEKFVLEWDADAKPKRKTEKQTWQQQLAILKLWSAAYSAPVKED